ncbi:MAG TPA: anti-sigma factor antagonist [Methylomirabilota bacterium]
MSATDPTEAGSTHAGPPSETEPAPPRPWRFRLRVHIATLFVALIAAAGLAIVGYGYRAASSLLLSAGDEEFRRVADHTAGQIRNLLSPARLLVSLLTRHRLTRTDTLAARLDAVPFLTAALARHPEISAVYVGFGNGDFFLVRSLGPAVRRSVDAPSDAAFLAQSVAASDRPAPGRYLFLDPQLRVIRNDPKPDYRFDPRTRGWYQQAVASDTLVRTTPYVFFTTREVGTTLAQRSEGSATVVGADITLQELSRHLAESRVTPSARIALVDRQGLVIAHPDAARLIRPAADGSLGLTRLGDLGDAVLDRLLVASGAGGRDHAEFSLGGRAWVGLARPLEVEAGDPSTLLLAAPRDELVAGARGLAQRQLAIGLAVLGLAVGLVWLSARRISRPLETLTRSVERMGQGDLDTALPEVWNPLEVGALRDVTDRMRRMLRGHIEERAARLAEEQRRARELDIAQQIQQSMLPTAPAEPLEGRYTIAATLQPAREVGGDLYDFFMLDGRRLVFAIADVADKGMPAALLMARVTGLLRAIGRGEAGPGEILREMDVRLSQGNEMCMFVTMACAVLDGESGELRYASAGHERPLLRRAGGTTTVLVVEGGPALGLGAEEAFPVWTGHLAPGDALVLCTDGVSEAFDAAGQAFGLERFRQVVAETPADALGTLPGRLVDAVGRFSAGGGPRDDLALLAIQYRPPDVEVDAQGSESWRLLVTSAPEAVGRARQSVETILRTRDVPEALVHDCTLATEELLANVVMHAYGGQPGGRAFVGVCMLPEEIQIRFEDVGPPFNPLERPAPDLDAPIAERPVGGLGLVLVRRLVDRWEYARADATNVVTLYWGRPVAPPAGRALEPETPAGRDGAGGLDIEVTRPGPAERRVALRGRLDSVTAPKLEAALAPVLERATVTSLVFRLQDLEYLSSAGIRCVVRARKLIEGRGGRVAIVEAQPSVRRVLEIVKAVPADLLFASQGELDAHREAGPRRSRGRH